MQRLGPQLRHVASVKLLTRNTGCCCLEMGAQKLLSIVGQEITSSAWKQADISSYNDPTSNNRPPSITIRTHNRNEFSSKVSISCLSPPPLQIPTWLNDRRLTIALSNMSVRVQHANLPHLTCSACSFATTSVQHTGPGANAGRSYWTCTNLDCENKGCFVRWGDDIGIHKNHPKCHCGLHSRYVCGVEGGHRYQCAEGICKFK